MDDARAVEDDDMVPAGSGGVAGAGVAACVLAGVIAVMAAVVLVAALASARWLDGRAFVVVAVVVAGQAGLWWSCGPGLGWSSGVGGPRVRRALGGAVAAGLAAVLVWTDLGRAELRGLTGDYVRPSLGDRVLDRDLPPAAAYAAGLAAGLLAVGFLALALVRWRVREDRVEGRRSDPRRRALAGAGAGALIGVLLVPAIVTAARDRRDRASERAEADTVVHGVSGRAERLGGLRTEPDVPASEMWRIESLPFSEETRQVLAVPDWDAVLVAGGDPFDAQDDPNGLVAYSATSGAELWRYESRAVFGPVTVDPDAGRVLVVGDDAAVVLRMDDGAQVMARRLPDGLSCGRQVDDTAGSDPRLTVAPVAALTCRSEGGTDGTLALVDVATADLAAAPLEPDGGDVDACGYSVVHGPDPAIMRWTDDPGCDQPALLTVDRARGARGAIEPLASIPAPRGLPAARQDSRPEPRPGARLLATGDLTVVSAVWEVTDRAQREVVQRGLVGVAADGAIRWRTSGEPVDAQAAAGPESDGRVLPVAASDRGIIAIWGGRWHLLSNGDGRQRAEAEPVVAGELTGGVAPVAGSGRVFAFPEDGGLVVRDVANLSVVASWQDFPRVDRGEAWLSGDGLVVYDAERGTLSAYTDLARDDRGPSGADSTQNGRSTVYEQIEDLCAELDLTALDPLAGAVVYNPPVEPRGDERGCYVEREGRSTPAGDPLTGTYDHYVTIVSTRILERWTSGLEFRGAFTSPRRGDGEAVRDVEDFGVPVWRAQISSRLGPARARPGDARGWHELEATLQVQDGNLLLSVELVGTVHGAPEAALAQYDDLLIQIGRTTLENLGH